MVHADCVVGICMDIEVSMFGDLAVVVGICDLHRVFDVG